MNVRLIAAVNALAVGLALGALGSPALVRVAAHAPLELGAFALVFWAYLIERRVGLSVRHAAALFGGAIVLLAGAAVVESFLSGAL